MTTMGGEATACAPACEAKCCKVKCCKERCHKARCCKPACCAAPTACAAPAACAPAATAAPAAAAPAAAAPAATAEAPAAVTFARNETLYTGGKQWGPPSNWNPLLIGDYATGTIGLVYGTVSIPISGLWEGAHAMSERRIKEQIAQNNLADSGMKLSTALAQLSSGLRINTAADDAAGGRWDQAHNRQ